MTIHQDGQYSNTVNRFNNALNLIILTNSRKFFILSLTKTLIILFLSITPLLNFAKSFASNTSSDANSTGQLSINESSQSNTAIKEYKVFPGTVILIKHELDKNKSLKNHYQLFCNQMPIPSFIENNTLKAFLSENYFSELKSYTCYLENNSLPAKNSSSSMDSKNASNVKREIIAKIFPMHKEYPQEFLKVDMKKLVLSKKNLKRAIHERKLLEQVYANSSNNKLFNKEFIIPLNTSITSEYGINRNYNNTKKSPHLGLDFRAPVGVPIPVSSDGKVVFTGNLFFTGGTVIVDHGLGIFTVYAHLSAIKCKVGKFLSTGTIVGLSGKSGRVSGPHLHWGVKINGNWIDGRSLVTSTVSNLINTI